MSEAYFLAPDLLHQFGTPDTGLNKHTIYNDERLRIILFAFASGHELAEHDAPSPVTLQFLQGDASVTLGEDRQEAQAGTLIHMKPKLPHGIVAKTPVLMLLYLHK